MKIEIEYEEVENLKTQFKKQIEVSRKLQEKLDTLDEKTLKTKAVDLSFKLFNDYCEAIFTKLDFDQSFNGPVKVLDDLEHWLGKNWWYSERLKIELGATITNQFRQAFLNLGIKHEKQLEDGI